MPDRAKPVLGNKARLGRVAAAILVPMLRVFPSGATLAATLLAACNLYFLDTRQEPVMAAEKAPRFALADPQGRRVSLDELTAEGPAVVVFYRGHW
jgi:cytochrome oxidase Cu insertion factor (SCO1/SenC/PrrC family)